MQRCPTIFLVVLWFQCPDLQAESFDVWLGTASDQGIFHATLDSESGKISEPRLAARIHSPGFLAFHPNGKILYAVGRMNDEPSVAAFELPEDDQRHQLRPLNSQPIGDGGAAHVAVDRSGRMVLTAQYGGSSVAVFPLQNDGRLNSRGQLIEHSGAAQSVPGRQDAPHPHWVGTSPDNRFAFVPDLGLDQVVVYRLSSNPLEIVTHGHADLPPGSGPRHMKFHPNGRWVFVLNELALTVTTCEYDAETGQLNPVATVPTITDDLKSQESTNSASEIRVHPSGKFLYTANRGHDTISVFRVESGGRLTWVESEPIRGAWPRNFNLDPRGQWLLAAGRDSNTLSTFRVDQHSGKLTYVPHSVVNVPSPICVLFSDE